MLKKANELALKAYINASIAKEKAQAKIRKEIEEFNSDERGISGIVIAVLLILVAVVLVAVFWDYLSDWFGSIWDKIAGANPDIGTDNENFNEIDFQ